MNKLSVTRVLRAGKSKQFHATELPLVRKMVGEIMDNKITYKQAMERYNVTKYQVEKWLFYLRNELTAKQSERFNEELKERIVRSVFRKRMSMDDAAAKYKVDVSTIKAWMRKEPKLKNYAIANAADIDEVVKYNVAHQVLNGSRSAVRAARDNRVSTRIVSRWVREYGIFNLDGSINHQILKTMSAEKKKRSC